MVWLGRVCLTIALVKDVSGSLAQVTIEGRRVSHDVIPYLEVREEGGGRIEGVKRGERGEGGVAERRERKGEGTVVSWLYRWQ